MFIGERAVNQRQRSLWIFFTAGIFFAASLIAVVRYVPLTHGLTFWFVAFAVLIVGAGIASLPYAGMALFFEMTTIVLAWFVFKGDGYGNSLFCYLPLVAAVLISVTYPVMPRSSTGYTATIPSGNAAMAAAFAYAIVQPNGCRW